LARWPDGLGDRWSDLDLTFAVEDGVPIGEVLDQWSDRLAEEFDAVRLVDLLRALAVRSRSYCAKVPK
jgi:hypothetical protein